MFSLDSNRPSSLYTAGARVCEELNDVDKAISFYKKVH